METKKITFTNFEIAYDGIYELIAEGKRHLIYLTPAMLLSLFETEGYTLKDAKHTENEYFKLPFAKSSISLFSMPNRWQTWWLPNIRFCWTLSG